MVYLVRSGTKQPKPFTASAADQARLLPSLFIDLRFQRAHRYLHQRVFLQHVLVELEPGMALVAAGIERRECLVERKISVLGNSR
ncbi:hypothetical protein ASD28_03705 [Massilia sp. Root133]|nr:hypothetical protein ASD28_03705 [Massilia sp. Root133]KQZ46380.1 hypothetical protein ASD92_26090 [Massilia sp. Root1485]